MRIFIQICCRCLLVFCMGALSLVAKAQDTPLDGYGVLIMHGTGGMPGMNDNLLASELKSKGALVMRPYMPWQGSKGVPNQLTVAMPAVVTQMDGMIDTLRAKGAQKIVVIGHSRGANMALAYGVVRSSNVDAIVMLAPGHNPDRQYKNYPEIAQYVDKAKALVDDGKGDETDTYPGTNQGKSFWTRSSAEAYWSWNDPHGMAVMPANASKLSPNIAVLYVIGTGDPLSRSGPSFIYDKLPKNPKTQYLVVEADHIGTPDAAAKQVVDWLIGLAH